jgi:hypothetical protein
MNGHPGDSFAYDQLYLYAMELGQQERGDRRKFILQHVVDAQAAQTANAETKPIKLIFGLLGLYLHLEKGSTGRQVQLAHMKLAKQKHPWPAIALPADRGKIQPADVMAFSAGDARDAAIDEWCRSVWQAYAGARQTIVVLMQEHGVV